VDVAAVVVEAHVEEEVVDHEGVVVGEAVVVGAFGEDSNHFIPHVAGANMLLARCQ